MGFTQETFAEAVGVEFSTVGQWERGALTPHPWRRPRVARVLKVSLEELDDLLGPGSAEATRKAPDVPQSEEVVASTRRSDVEGDPVDSGVVQDVVASTSRREWPPLGIVSGFVLTLGRKSTGLTQETVAELVGVDVAVVRDWESGRRPLAATGAGELLALSARLCRAGAPATIRRYLHEAIEADLVLSTGITAGATWVDPDRHPLAAAVHRRNVTNLITWPLTGHTPPQLDDLVRTAPAGPVSAYPLLHPDERTRFFDHLLSTAQRAGRAEEPLLRRQAVYLVGFDRRGQVADWLRDEWHRAGHRTITDGDVTGLLEARSASVALASTGENEHIHDFVDRTSGTQAEIANLNYWAYWIGELRDVRTDDSFMTDEDSRAWHGGALLTHLAGRLDPASPHLPLNLHTLHTLVASRPGLLDTHRRLRPALTTALDTLAAGDVLTRTGRDRVAGLRYALRLSGR
ncbi:hypothetical protein GCM10022243_32230 [Saccharothrix violaceirubra]